MPKSTTAVLSVSLLLAGFTVTARAGAPGAAREPDPGHELGDHETGIPSTIDMTPAYTPLTGKQRVSLYVRDAFWSPAAFFGAAGPALGAHWKNEPPSWGQGMEGYSKRFANRFARSALQATYEAAGAAALKHEVRYVRSGHPGLFRRVAHALAAEFVTYDHAGRRTPHVSHVGSVFAAEFTATRWMPPGYRDVSTALRGVSVQFGVGGAVNLFREFSPELKRLFGRD